MASLKRMISERDNPWVVQRIRVGDAMRHVAVMTCGCGLTETIALTKELPLDVLANKFVQKGWDIRRRTPVCPRCIANRKTPQGETMSTAISMTVRDLNPIEHRRVMSLLEAHFDEKTGRYVNKHSDQTIADEVKIPRAAVKSLREKFFGPLKSDPEITAIREEIDRMLGKLADLSARLDRVEKQAS